MEDTMDLFQKIPWPVDDVKYEIWLLYDDRKIAVATFLNNHPANGLRYLVQIPKRCDSKTFLVKHPVPELVEACKRDIAEKRWEVYKKILEEIKSQEV
jgi:hypothetical protein